jgi:outer membrane receptor protein involved in Fe transport
MPGLHARAGEPDDPALAIVTVTATKAAVVKKVDRTVYDVTAMAQAANGTAQDVLQALPEVSMSTDGQLAVKGNKQVTVLIDGKPAAVMSGEERAAALQTMNGADLASIDVITNPSAAYNANGGAIINIVLKHNRKPGTHGQLQGSATDQSLWNVGASGDITGKDLGVHGNLAYRHDGTVKRRESTVDWLDPGSGQTGHTQQTSEVFVHRVVETAGLGADYALGEFDSVSVQTHYNRRHSHPLLDVLNDNRIGPDETIFHRISYGLNQQSDASASAAWSHQDRGTAWKAVVQHSDTSALIDKSYRDVFVSPALPTDASHGATDTGRRLNQATLDWSRGEWGVGVDVQDRVDTVANYQATIDPVSGFATPDPGTTNDFGVSATTSAAYVTKQVREGKWDVLLGGRGERTVLRVNQSPSRAWQAVNPSVNLKYAATGAIDLTFSYRRSLQMPDPRDLDPFTTYVDAQNRSRGNPALMPQHLASWELGADIDAGPMSSSAGMFYRTSSDTVVDARSVDADNVLLTSKQNGGHASSAGVTGSRDWTVNPRLKLGVDGSIYRVMLATLDQQRLVRQDDVAAYVNARATYSAGMDDLALDAHWQAAGVNPLGRFGATSSVNATWKHKLNKTLALTVNANDMFDGSRRTYSTTTATIRQAGFDHFVGRRVYVGMVKKFD